MRQQSRKRANTICCLKFADEEQLSTCHAEENLQSTWNPIVYPSAFGTSWNASSSGAFLGGYGQSFGRSRSLFNQEWNDKLDMDDIFDEEPDAVCSMEKCFPGEQYLWEVSGYHYIQDGDLVRKEEFCYTTLNVVMACGQEKPNTLDIPGENLPFVLHSLKELEAKIALGELNSQSEPVIVVGAGLSAADAIIAASEHNLKVIHIFRREAQDRNLIFKNLPAKLYPEYHQVHRMMNEGMVIFYSFLTFEYIASAEGFNYLTDSYYFY